MENTSRQLPYGGGVLLAGVRRGEEEVREALVGAHQACSLAANSQLAEVRRAGTDRLVSRCQEEPEAFECEVPFRAKNVSAA